VCHISCSARPLGRILVKHPHHKRRNSRVHSLRQRWDRFIDVRDRNIESSCPGERAFTDKSFVGDDAERVNI